MDSFRNLYNETHIFPTEQDFLHQANNVDWMYLVLYWLKKEHLYELFLEEEMDYQTMTLMNEHDLRYFHLDRCEPLLRWLVTLG